LVDSVEKEICNKLSNVHEEGFCQKQADILSLCHFETRQLSSHEDRGFDNILLNQGYQTVTLKTEQWWNSINREKQTTLRQNLQNCQLFQRPMTQ